MPFTLHYYYYYFLDSFPFGRSSQMTVKVKFSFSPSQAQAQAVDRLQQPAFGRPHLTGAAIAPPSLLFYAQHSSSRENLSVPLIKYQ